MIQSNFKRTIFIVLILISFQNSNQAIEFTVESLENRGSCSALTKSFSFGISGTFSEKTSYFSDEFNLDLETSDGKKIKSKCSPLQLLGVYKLSCNIDIVHYPLNKVDIFLPTKAPQITGYTFKNWEQIIGSESGVSNKISEAECLPKEENIFTPSSINVGDCLIDRSFTINGDWEKEVKISDYYSTEIILDNDNKDIAKCRYMGSTNPIHFDCNFDGSGSVKFKEQFFQILSKVYKIKEFDSGKTVNVCSDEEFDDIRIAGSFYYLNKIFLIIYLLLF